MVILAGILFGAVFVYAQFSESDYLVKTVHIFPSEIEAEAWNNASTLSFQNLDEYALLQEFNAINSATLNLSTGVSLELDKQQRTIESQESEEDVVSEETVTETEQKNVEVATDTASTTQTGINTATSTATSTPTPTEIEFDVVVDGDTFIDSAPSQETTSTEPLSPDPVPAEQEQSADSDAATTTVMKRAQSIFRLAVNTVTSLLDSATGTPTMQGVHQSSTSPTVTENSTSTEPTPEEVVSIATSTPDMPLASSTPTELMMTATTSATDSVAAPEPGIDEDVQTDTSEQSSSTQESSAGSDSQIETISEPNQTTDSTTIPDVSPCTDDCKPYVITLSDFGYPLEVSTEVTGAQLRMSFAAQKKSYRDRIPAFGVRYSMDNGTTWSTGGSIVIEDEVSNSINGGYFLFALPEVNGEADLDLLQVELSYRDDPTVLADLFLESVWLELFTLETSGNAAGSENFADALLNDGFDSNMLNGDTLELPNGEMVDFEFTDENVGETLIIKSDKADYVGLTKTTTYFSVTNEGNRADEFTLQTYFPRGVGEVKTIREYQKNKPKEVVVPEYRPFVYHCEAGWEFAGEVSAGSLSELSQQLVPVEEQSEDETVDNAHSSSSDQAVEPASDANQESRASSTIESESAQNVEFDILVPEEDLDQEQIDTAPTNTTTTVSLRLPSVQRLLQSSTTTLPVGKQDDFAGDVQEEEQVDSYLCRNTNVVRTCDSIGGDNTACRIENMKVAEHQVTNYAPGWASVEVATGTMPKPGFIKRTLQFIGFGPDKKEVKEGFEVKAHSENSYTIEPGETKYFEMEISFPPFSAGEYWIEAIGDREYGLLDPFWSSQWRYRKPISIDNTSGTELTEQQVFLELTSADSDFWTNVQADGGDIRFVRETPGNNLTWWDTNWDKRVQVTIPAASVDDDLVDFPVYVDLNTLGSSFFADVASDGRDIRIVDDASMPNEQAYDLVSIDTGAETGELHFEASSLSSSTDNVFYVYFDNAAATAYAAGDTYGSQAVWSNNFDLRYALDDDPSSSGLQLDSTSNGNDAMSYSGMTSGDVVTGQIGEALNHDGNDGGVFGTSLPYAGEFTASMWWRSTADGFAISRNSGATTKFGTWTGGNIFTRVVDDSDTTLAAPADGTWAHVVLTRDSTDKVDVYLDGVPTRLFGDAAQSGLSDWENFGGQTTQGFQGDIDELRFASVKRSDGWVSTEYSNQNNPSSFYTAAAVETLSVATFTELDHWVQHFDSTAQETDIWVQVDTIAAAASSTVYLYYGNTTAEPTSDEYAPFTYSTTTDLYYVVSDIQTSPIVVYSYIDDNEVSIDGGAPVTLQSGETTSFSTYSSSSVISAFGPITARTSDALSEPPVPISFATTTNLVTTNRTNETFYVHAPFADAAVDVYEGANVAPTATGTVLTDTTASFAVNIGGSDSGILESDEPVLLFHSGTNDSYVAYPPTTRPIFGVYSNTFNYAAITGGTSVGVYCSDGTSGTTTGMTRGGEQSNTHCTNGSQGTGNGVMLANATNPIAATQEADSDGGESSRFLPTPEFGTRYILPQDTEYVTVVCSPRLGTSTIEIQTSAGATIDSGTCAPAGVSSPGVLNFNPGSLYSQGYQVVSTNNVAFYMYYEENSNNDETNTWSAVQAKQYNALYASYSVGAEEENEDAQYEQKNYRWYQNTDGLTPSTSWPAEDGATVAEGEAIATGGAVNPGDTLRLRMNLLANNGTGTVDSTAFELQYTQAETCSAVAESAWVPVAEIGSTTVAFAGYNNTTPGDGAVLPSTLLSDSDVSATYEEQNASALLPNQVGNGQAVEFDWSLTAVAPVVNSEYCFRMVRSATNLLATHTVYPELLTAGPPETTTLLTPFDNEHATSTTPYFTFVAADVGGDDLDYEIDIATDKNFSSIVQSRDSDSNPFEFENVNNSSDKAPFNNGQTVQFIPPSSLSNGQTYWWRVRAIDPDGSNTFGAYSTAHSFTVNTAVTVSQWFQTTGEQFDTNSLSSATTSSGGSVELDIAGSNLVGEYGTVSLTNGATSSVSLNNSFTNPVVVASIRYPRSIASPNQPALRVFNKTGTGFDIIADNFSKDSSGTSTADYVVVEAGDWLIDDGGSGVRVYATSTSVSTIAGSIIATNPGGPVITYPTSFSSAPAVLTMVTTNNDPQWVVSSVYDGNNISNPPTASQVGLYLNDNLDSNGHGSAEDIDVVVFDVGDGVNNSVNFDTQTTAADVTDTPNTKTFSPSFSAVPGVTLVQQLTMNGGQGGYAQVDLDTPATASGITVSIEEGGSGADRGHAAESVAIVAFESGSGDLVRSGNAQMTSTPIDFDDVVVGNSWGEVSWSDTGDVAYRVQYQTGNGFQDVPDSALAGNSTGFTTSPVNILDLDTVIYNELRLVAELSGVSPEVFDWTVSWGQRVNVPTLGDPFDNEKTADTTPQFDFTTNDPQGDDLEYEISYSTDSTFATGSTTINSNASSSDFTNLTNGGDSNPYTSGDQISYTIPAADALTDGQTYWWRVRAKDPSGSNSFSPWSEPDNFTVDTTTVISSWFQTTQAQFREGVIDGVVASTSNSVELSNEVGEYGTTTVTDNNWQTVTTELSYDDMVVVASPKYAFNGTDNGRTIQVRNKTANSFEIKAENYTTSLTGTTEVNYIVMGAGDWVLDDGASGMRVVAGTAADVATVNGSNITYSAGSQITFSPSFSVTPGALSTVSTANGSKWVSARVDDGTEAGEITASNMYVSLGSELDTDTTRVPEDIDYIAFAPAAGTNNGVLFDAFNSADSVTNSDTAISFNQTFSSAPGLVVVQNNGMDGGDGGSALQDTDTPTNATTLYASIAEHGPGAGNHTAEIISAFVFADSTGTILRDSAASGGLSGTIASEEVLFSDGTGPKFDRAVIGATTPGASTVSIQVEYQTATGSWALIPDGDFAGNSTGFTGATVDLSSIDVGTYQTIRLLATLSCDGSDCPALDDWAVEWSEGVTMSGTLQQYDRLTNVSTATVTVSVNGAAPTRTGTVSAGVWSISNVTAFAGDIVTVFVSDVPDAQEAVAVFKYDGLGDMTGVELFEQHLSLSADETATTTIADLGLSDNGLIGDEDVFFNVNLSGDLSVCAVGSCGDANIYIGPGNVFIPSASSAQTITAHDIVNDGTVELDGNTVRVSGSWDNNNSLTIDTSNVIFTATAGTETISDSIGTLTFNNITFGDGSGAATWQPQNPLDVNGNLAVNFGTLDRGVLNIQAAKAISTGISGFWSGVGTTTFDGSGNAAWTDANPVSQSIGRVVVDGSVRTVTVGSNVLASSITIGTNDTLSGGGANDIQIQGNFTNNNVFVPSTSRIIVTGTATNATIQTGGNNLYAVRASSSAGSVTFVESTVTLLDNLEIATGTVTFPTTLLRIGGSLSNTGGNFAHNNAQVLFTGSGSETIEVQGTAFLNSFYDVSFTGTGDWTFLDSATTTNTWTQSNGSVTLPSEQLTVGRDFTTTAPASFDANGGEVIFLVAGNDSITTNGSPFHDVRVREQSGGASTWYNENWLYRIPVTIRSSEIDDDLTNFPVFVDLTDLPSSFFANLNSDGGDIRVTLNDGVTEVSREVVSASTTAETGELYFLASTTLSSTTDEMFYIYYGNTSASDYAVTDTYGAENVWSNGYVLVAHMNDLTTASILNSANGSLNGTKESTNNPTETTTGKIYEAQDSSADHISFGNLGGGATAITIDAWFNSDNLNPGSGDPDTYGQTIFSAHSSGNYTWVTVGGTGGGGSPSEARFCAFDSSPTCDVSSGAGLQDNTWHYVSAAAIDGGAATIRVDGAQVANFTSDGGGTWNSGSTISDLRPNRNIEFDGELDEIRVSNVVRSNQWRDASYRNQATTTDFYAVGSPQQDNVRTVASTNIEATGDVVVESGTIVFPTGIFSIGGSLQNADEFDSNGGTVRFNATTTGHSVDTGNSRFYNLTFAGAGGGWNITQNATATNAITLSNGNGLTVDSGVVLESTGTFFNDMNNASTTWTGATLRLSGGGDFSLNNKNNGGDTYETLELTGDGDIKMWNSTAGTYNTNDTSSIYSQDHAGVDGDLYIFGDYNRTAGVEYWSYATDFDGVSLGATSSRQANVRVVNGGSVNVSTSSLEILGATTASTTIDAQSGDFALTAAYATVTAQYFTMTGTDTSGFNLTSSTTVLTLSDSVFTIPTGASAIIVDASTIDTNPARQFFNTNFVTGGGNVNVTLSGSPVSYWWFRDGVGDRYGEAFDNADADPGAIRWDDSSYTINISGTVFSDDGTTPQGGPVCDGATTNVRIVVNGGTYTDSVSCSGVDGSYSFSNVAYIGDPSIIVYLDTNGGDKGAVVTKTPTSDITDLDIYANRVMTRHEDVAPLTIADMVIYDEGDDTDIPFVAATGTPDTLIVRPDTELIIASSTTFVPGGNITLQSAGSGQSYDGSLHLDNGATLTAAGTETHSIGGSFLNDQLSTFVPASSTILFTATTSGKGITQLSNTTLSFYEAQFTGVGGGWNITADISVAADMDITAGTVTGTGDITMQNGQLSGAGLLSMGGGTTTINTSSTLGGAQGWTFYDLVLGDGSTVGTTTRSDTATTTIANQLVISPAHYLDTGSSVWNLSGTGTVFKENGTLLQDMSTFVYSGGGSVDVLSTNYYNLQFGGAAGTPLYSFGATGVLIENDLLVTGGVSSEVDIDANDPVVSVLGNVDITSNGVLSLSNTADFTLSGNYINTGTLSANAGTVVFDSADAYDIAAGASAFADVSLEGVGAVTISENATSTGLFTIASSSDFTLNPGVTLAVGGQLAVESATTNWSGSTLSLYGGGDYLVNSKDLSLSLENLTVAAGTEVRTWNTVAVSQTVDPAGSWYSQDHAGVDGDLYIFGAYTEESRSDYWNYTTDFDGADLTGTERQVDVYFANGASALWTGGLISVIGDPTATTTLQNQGSGTYSVTIGGTATADWQYINVRDIDSDGLTFSGSPTVSGFANADLLVEINGGSAVTVGATAITASPARTLSDVVFNSDVGVTGAINVTATGTTLSGWRFTSHSGNLDGESFDQDPAGDPGYVIWDDSAAIISISGNVYEADGSTVSSVCDDTTTNVLLSIAGSLAQNASSSCSSADGSYTISGVSFGSLDELMLYIDGESDKGAMVTKDPISSISDADIYENHVIVRHENVTPLSIADMAVWDSSDDADIPYTAVDAGTDTLTLPADTKLLVWDSKEFAPAGDITLNGGGAGASYDGSFEALSNAAFTTAGNESHSIGGSFEFAASADFEAASSTVTFTSDAAARTISVNTDVFHNATFTGTGSWSIVDTNSVFENDLTVSGGALTLSSGTTTIGGSLANTSTLDTNSGLLFFNAQAGSHTVALGGSDASDVTFAGTASWTMLDTNATSTGSLAVATGTVTLPAGVLSIANDFIVLDTVLHNSGTVQLSNAAGDTTLTLSGNDLFSVKQTGAATTTMTDGSAAFLGDLFVNNGAFLVATDTLSIGGSLDVSAAVLETASGTLLFNSDDTGEFVDVGNNVLYNAVFANGSGGWAVFSATTTNNFSLTTANDFTLVSGESLTVGGVFQNTVGGANTTWANTTLNLDGENAYTVNSKTTGGDEYETVFIGGNSDIRIWNSVATTTNVDSSSSLYSQDHSAVNGALYVYGDFAIGTSSEYWNYATDFDGTALTSGNERQVTVFQAENSTTTLAAAGSLQVIGTATFPTTVQNQSTGTYALNINGGQLHMNQYSLTDMDAQGLDISGTPVITSLTAGEYSVGVNGGNAITLEQSALDANPSLVIDDAVFATVLPATIGTNVNLSATSTNSWTFRNETGDIAGENHDIDGITNCGSIRWDDSSCLLTEQTEYRWRNDDGGIGVPDSEWFDINWNKRKHVRVANNDTVAYATATVKITVIYDADMQTDFDDLRFTSSDGVTPIDFWIEKYTSGVSADVWITVNDLAAQDTISAYMYYGNFSAGSVSSSTETMIAADDFEDGDITEYSGQTSLFQVDAGSAYGGSFGLELNAANKGTRLNPGIARFDQTISQGQTIRFMQYVDTTAGASDEVCTLFGVQSPATLNQNYGVCLEQFGTDRITLAKNILSTDNFGTVTQLATSTVAYTTGWYEIEVDWLTDDSIDVRLYNPSGSLVTSVSATDATYSSGGYGFTSWGQNGDWDSYTARPYLTTQPTVFFGVEQVDGGATYASAQNQVTSTFSPGTTARLRVAIENTGLDITAQEFTLEYAAKDVAPSCAAVSEASYATVPLVASCGSSAVCMSTSTVVANGAATGDLLDIDRGTFSAGTFVENPSNATNPIDVDQNFYTELEYALQVTTNATDQSYCFRVTDAGTAYDSYANVPELSLKFDPVIGTISLNQGADISLIPGTTTAVYATGTVTDFNGAADLVFATSTIYRSGVAGGAACSPDNNNCYVSNTASSCEFTACAGNSCEVQCRADMFFHAEPTDFGTFDGQEWLAFIEVEDASGGYDFASAIGVEVSTLRAIDVSGSIDYGALEVNADTGSFNASTSVLNLGNVEADLEVTGSDLTDGLSSVIPANQQKFATSTFDYTACVGCELLSSSTPVQIDVELTKPAAETPPVSDDVYWGIAVPFGINSVPHTGINVFTPVSP